jgi:hypothetical protein
MNLDTFFLFSQGFITGYFVGILSVVIFMVYVTARDQCEVCKKDIWFRTLEIVEPQLTYENGYRYHKRHTYHRDCYSNRLPKGIQV